MKNLMWHLINFFLYFFNSKKFFDIEMYPKKIYLSNHRYFDEDSFVFEINNKKYCEISYNYKFGLYYDEDE